MAQERLFELPELVATDACPRIEVVRRDRERLEHLGELLRGQRFAALAVLASLGPRTALDRDQRLDHIRRRDFHGHFLGEHVCDRRPPSLANASRMSASRSASREASSVSVLISVPLDGCTGPAERRGERRPAETAWDEVRAVACKPWGEIANP